MVAGEISKGGVVAVAVTEGEAIGGVVDVAVVVGDTTMVHHAENILPTDGPIALDQVNDGTHLLAEITLLAATTHLTEDHLLDVDRGLHMVVIVVRALHMTGEGVRHLLTDQASKVQELAPRREEETMGDASDRLLVHVRALLQYEGDGIHPDQGPQWISTVVHLGSEPRDHRHALDLCQAGREVGAHH